MRHRNGNKKLSKPTDQRLALLRTLAVAFSVSGKIKTTDVRAKEVQKVIEHLITLGKDGSLHARRQALRMIPNNDIVNRYFQFATQYADRSGGYTRRIKLGFRQGDGAPVTQLELVA